MSDYFRLAMWTFILEFVSTRIILFLKKRKIKKERGRKRKNV